MASVYRSTPRTPEVPRPPPSAPRQKAGTKAPAIFKTGTRCVHPQHGVVEVVGVVERDVGGSSTPFYELKLVASDGKILIPVAAAERAGLRPIMSEAEADSVLEFMKTRRPGPDARPFQKRMRIYGEMIRSGDRQAIAEVLRDMHVNSVSKDLSFGERKLLTQAQTMLVTELALAKHTSVEAIEQMLEAAFVAA